MNKMIFQTKERRYFHIIYISLILLYLLVIPIVIFSSQENLHTKLLVIPFVIFFYFITVPNYRSGSYTISFEEDGFRYKNVFGKGYISYHEIEEIVYVKTRAKTGWNYTVEIRRKKGRPLYFSTTFLKNSKEREQFKREWRKRTKRQFRHRKGHLLS